jgi:sugar lactone lactonase YvrE
VYETHTGVTREVAGGLAFANGIVLSADESFAIVAETWASQLRRIWLQGTWSHGTPHGTLTCMQAHALVRPRCL